LLTKMVDDRIDSKEKILSFIARLIDYAVETREWRHDHEQTGVCTPLEVLVNELASLHLHIYHDFMTEAE